VLDQYDGTEMFKQEASFKTHKTIVDIQGKMFVISSVILKFISLKIKSHAVTWR